MALSKLVKSTSQNDTLDVNWDTVYRWMFGQDNCSDENMLKAFIRSQIYRPLFFTHDNYTNFTSNQIAYSCTTDKYFTDHNGIERSLCASDETMDAAAIKSALERGVSGYTIDLSSIKYFNTTNKFEYDINYNPVDIVSNKFVINDVEFYVVRSNPGEAITKIYFNEFQGNTEGQNQVAQVSGNKFNLNGKEYVIEGNEISIDAATSEFSGDEKEWKCGIVDDMFQFDGTWYVLAKNGSNQYVSVGYADNKDNNLIEILVTSEGYATYKPWDISF